MVRVEVTEINPSLSVTAESVLTLILSPSSGGVQVKEGSGTPLAVQVKVTTPPSSSTTAMSASGLVRLTGSGGSNKIKDQRIHLSSHSLPCTVTVNMNVVVPAALVAVTL